MKSRRTLTYFHSALVSSTFADGLGLAGAQGWSEAEVRRDHRQRRVGQHRIHQRGGRREQCIRRDNLVHEAEPAADSAQPAGQCHGQRHRDDRAEIRNAEEAGESFDAITYPKGASVLGQLMHYVGESTFEAGMAAYFTRHAWGNTTLQDLIEELASASGRDLNVWRTAWRASHMAPRAP